VDRNVVDGHLSDPALEAARMRVPVQDEVRRMLGDRKRKPARAEEREDASGLPDERLLRRGVVEQDDPQRAVRDLLEPAGDRVRLLRRLLVDLP
jgi:hypothetical protein